MNPYIVRLRRVAIGAVILSSSCADSGIEPVEEPWVSAGLEGKSVLALANTPSGTFAGTRMNGVFKYSGGDWEPVGLADRTVTSLIYVDGSPGFLLAGLSPEINTPADATTYYTDDGGVTWLPRDGGPPDRPRSDYAILSLSADPLNRRTLVAGTYQHVLLSDDGAVTWRTVYDGTYGMKFDRVAIASDGNELTLWAGGGNAQGQPIAIVSRDGGSAWDTVGDVSSTALTAADPIADRVWIGGVGHISSFDVESGDLTQILEFPREFGSITAFDVIGPSIYAAAEGAAGSTILRSLDEGRSWQRLDLPPATRGIRSILADFPEGLLVGTEGSGVWLSPGM